MADFGDTIIEFNKDKGLLKISGISMMEDALEFYVETKSKIDGFLSSSATNLTIEFELTYFNSSSAKQFIQILTKLEGDKGNAIWKYPKDHSIMHDRGKELEILVDVPFEFIAI